MTIKHTSIFHAKALQNFGIFGLKNKPSGTPVPNASVSTNRPSESLYERPFQHAQSEQGCQICLGPNIPKREKINKRTTNSTKRLKNIPNGRKINQHFPFNGPPKHTQIGIFGLKINHLATLNQSAAIF
jgi:hypothetical protein